MAITYENQVDRDVVKFLFLATYRRPVTAAEITEALSEVHAATTVNYHLQKLVKDGTIDKRKRNQVGLKGRAPYEYYLSELARSQIDDEAGIGMERAIGEFNTKASMLNRGEILYCQGKYDEAIQFYDAILQMDPKFHSAWEKKGAALEKLGRRPEAEDALRRARELYRLRFQEVEQV